MCGRQLTPLQANWCSGACRQRAYRLRQQTPQPAVRPTPPAGSPAKAFTVYACPSCEQRLLGEQRCPDCNVFTRRVGYGGLCPHCDEPVTVAEIGLTSDAGAQTTPISPPEVRVMVT